METCNKSLGHRSFSFTGPTEWNSIVTKRSSPLPVCLFILVSLKNLPLHICAQLNSHWSYLFQVCVCVCACVCVRERERQTERVCVCMHVWVHECVCVCVIQYIYVISVCVCVCDPVHLCNFSQFFCEACKARCAHPAWVRYRAIKIHLLLLLLTWSPKIVCSTCMSPHLWHSVVHTVRIDLSFIFKHWIGVTG